MIWPTDLTALWRKSQHSCSSFVVVSAQKWIWIISNYLVFVCFSVWIPFHIGCLFILTATATMVARLLLWFVSPFLLLCDFCYQAVKVLEFSKINLILHDLKEYWIRLLVSIHNNISTQMEPIMPKCLNILGPFVKHSGSWFVFNTSAVRLSSHHPVDLPLRCQSHVRFLFCFLSFSLYTMSPGSLCPVCPRDNSPNRDKHGNVFIITLHLFVSWMHVPLHLPRTTVRNETDLPECSVASTWKEQHRKTGRRGDPFGVK